MSDDQTNWHAMEHVEVTQRLGTSDEGLTTGEVTKRREKFGYNELIEKKRTTALQIFFRQFKDIFVIMLLVAIVLSFAIGWYKSSEAGGSLDEYVDAITIGAIVVLNSVVGFVQEFRSEKAIEAMKKLAAPNARVMRNNKEMMIPSREVVPGDIVLLEAGDRIPADIRLFQNVELRTEEAALTGESTPIRKDISKVNVDAQIADRKNMLFMGTHVTYGRGKGVVTATAMNTEFGKIAEMMQTVEEEGTPLQRKLERFAKKLGIMIVGVTALVFVLELIREGTAIDNILDVFLTSVALAVSAVPEGLPAVVTVSLALGARELAKRNALIRKLASAETLGATTIICSDKTGTLTKGEMTVRKIFVDSNSIDVTGVGYQSQGDFLLNGSIVKPEKDSTLNLILTASTLCSNAHYDGKTILGDTTEGAFIVAAAKAGILRETLEKTYSRVHEIPFTSERKRMTTVYKVNDSLVAFVKGAPEIILDRCTRITLKGKPQTLTGNLRKKIQEENSAMAGEALRVLGVAMKTIPKMVSGKFKENELETDMVFIGLIASIDPPRKEAKEAIQKCRRAGIKTVMVTGDHRLTAVAVAKELGLINDDRALTGSELDALSDEEFGALVESVSVYARVSPEHKLRMVNMYKQKGHIVAMTGDGVNDAPALKQADIGIAMGITGTDVTKEAADLVLTDDNFATIVTAVEGGRAIFDNIRKFSFFLLRSNFDEVALLGTFALLGLPLPLTAGMILWLNLVSDGGPALALTMDPPDKDIMERPPRNPADGVLYGRIASIIATFSLQFALTGGLFIWQYYLLPGPLTPLKLAQARTMAFVRATLQELFIVWNCRSEKRNAFRVGFFSNKFLLFAVVASAVLTVLVPYFGWFGTVWLDDPMEWLIALVAALSGLLILPEVFYGRKVWKWR